MRAPRHHSQYVFGADDSQGEGLRSSIQRGKDNVTTRCHEPAEGLHQCAGVGYVLEDLHARHQVKLAWPRFGQYLGVRQFVVEIIESGAGCMEPRHLQQFFGKVDAQHRLRTPDGGGRLKESDVSTFVVRVRKAHQIVEGDDALEPILGGSGQISGGFTAEAANQLAIQLKSGALPAKLTIEEERTVGPSLGADSIESGRLAGIVGVTATVALIIFVYGTFGLFAVVGLIANALLIVAIMSAIGSTLTLPGIAGLILTIGMAVDANVLIYERIREELRNGKTAVNAIDAGFGRAMVTILDSQLTTFAAAVIMFWLGSGPIRGFAVTLSIGIFTSIFTAVTVVRLLVALWVRSQRGKARHIEVPL